MFFGHLRRFTPWIGAAMVALQPFVVRALDLGPLPPNTGLAEGKLMDLIGPLIGKGLAVLGIVALLLILYAGFLWMTAQGETEKVEKARDIMIQATIGLIIISLAYSSASYVTDGLTSALGGGVKG